MGDHHYISFDYLFKQISFGSKFKRRLGATFNFNGENVESFYADSHQQKKQIKVHYYCDSGNFLISIPDSPAPCATLQCLYKLFCSSNDVIYFLKTGENISIDEVVERVEQEEGKGSQMDEDDNF